MDEELFDEIDVTQMLGAKRSLQCVPISLQNNEYKDILKKVTQYLEKHCSHIFEHDWIDTDIDSGGQQITYCIKCEHTVL